MFNCITTYRIGAGLCLFLAAMTCLTDVVACAAVCPVETVQGTAADIIKKALGLLIDRIDDETKIVAVVHDEILIECPKSRSEEAAAILKSAMEDAVNGILPDVPTTVEPVVSSSWAEK